jgi:hypothetical protein
MGGAGQMPRDSKRDNIGSGNRLLTESRQLGAVAAYRDLIERDGGLP